MNARIAFSIQVLHDVGRMNFRMAGFMNLQHLSRFGACLFVIYLWLGLAPLAQATPIPKLKPKAPNTTKLLSDNDARLFREGLRLGERGQWREVKALYRRLNDPIASDVLRWYQAAQDQRASLEDLNYVTQRLQDWPRMTRIRSKAEALLFDRPQSANYVINWFSGFDPVKHCR